MNVAGGLVNETVKSTDGGDTWTTVSGLPQVRCNHLRISKAYPTDPVVFATPQGQGIYRSNDNGMTWADISGPLTNQNIRSCILSPDFSTDGTLFAGSVGKGLYRSTDRGDNWTMIRGLPSSANQTIESIGVSPNYTNDQTLFVVSWFDGVYASTDGGNSWQPRNAGLPLDSSRVIRLSPTYASDSTVYVTTHAWTYRSQDAGTTWSRLPGFNRIDENHPTVLHHGRWTKEGSGASFGNTLMNSNTPGDVESFEFYGDAITWFTKKDSTSGWAEVWLDGVSVGVVDLYSSTPLHSQVAWSKTFSQAGWHQVEISVLGSTSSQSAGTFIRSDGFETRF